MIKIPRAYDKKDVFPSLARIINLDGRITFSATEEKTKVLVKLAIPIANEDDVEIMNKLIMKRRPNTISKGKITIELYRDRVTDEVKYFLIGIILVSNPLIIGGIVNSFVNRVLEVYRKGDVNTPLQSITEGGFDGGKRYTSNPADTEEG